MFCKNLVIKLYLNKQVKIQRIGSYELTAFSEKERLRNLIILSETLNIAFKDLFQGLLVYLFAILFIV